VPPRALAADKRCFAGWVPAELLRPEQRLLQAGTHRRARPAARAAKYYAGQAAALPR